LACQVPVLVAGPAAVSWPQWVSDVFGLPAWAVASAASLLSSLEEPELKNAKMNIQVGPRQKLPELWSVVLKRGVATVLLQKVR